MSLFGGGDSSGPPSPSQASDFSISTIGDRQSQTSRSQGSPETRVHLDDANDEYYAQPAVQAVTEEERRMMSNSPSATSDTSEIEFRPNRFRGSDRAWLHHTNADRSLAHSLDQINANDLSLHLYNAHHLKLRLRHGHLPSSVKPWSRKSRWISTDQDIQKPWHPDSDWTAWPLPSDVAPTGNEVFGRPNDGLDNFTLRPAVQHTSADHLREQLHAVFLAHAHESWKASQQRLSAPALAVAEPRLGTPTPSAWSSPATRRRSRSRSAGPSSIPSSPSVGDDLPPLSSLDRLAVETSSQGNADPPQEAPIKDENGKIEDERLSHAAFSADDDRSRALLHPSVNHVMSKLDRLLLALHQSRQALVQRTRDGNTSDSSARSNSRSRSTSNKPSKTKPKSKDAAAPIRHSRRRSAAHQSVPFDDAIFDDSDEDKTYEPESPKRRSRSPSNRASSPETDDQVTSPSGKKRRNARRPGLRDWSEVLGLATLNGWDPAVVDRARKRCSTLFGENMQLYSMAEHGDSSADEAEHTHHLANSRSNRSAGWRCPLSNCFRNIHPFEHGFRWREHMRKAHKYDKDQISRLETQLVQSGHLAPPKRHHVLAHNPRGWQPPDPLKCPHCPGSEQTFAKISRLLDHIKRGHKYDPRIQSPPRHIASKEVDAALNLSSFEDDSDGYMVGGVHNDGFLQPVLRHAGARGRDLEQRAKRADVRRSKAELKNAKKRKASVDEVF